MFHGVDHVVIAVKDLDAAVGRYETIYGTGVSDRSEAPAAGMAMAFFRFGDSYIERLAGIARSFHAGYSSPLRYPWSRGACTSDKLGRYENRSGFEPIASRRVLGKD